MVDDDRSSGRSEVAAETGALVMVHAENGDAIDVLVKQALAAGNCAALPRTDASSRDRGRGNEPRDPARAGGRAPLYVVHVSCKEAVDPIARAREQGWDVWGETCTQYAFVDYTFLERPDFEGAPCTRRLEVDREPGGALARGPLGHPLRRVDRPLRVSLGRPEDDGEDDFSKRWGPGLENRLHMIHGSASGPVRSPRTAWSSCCP